MKMSKKLNYFTSLFQRMALAYFFGPPCILVNASHIKP